MISSQNLCKALQSLVHLESLMATMSKHVCNCYACVIGSPWLVCRLMKLLVSQLLVLTSLVGQVPLFAPRYNLAAP